MRARVEGLKFIRRAFRGRGMLYVFQSKGGGSQLKYGARLGEPVWRWWLRDPIGFRAYAMTFDP